MGSSDNCSSGAAKGVATWGRGPAAARAVEEGALAVGLLRPPPRSVVGADFWRHKASTSRL